MTPGGPVALLLLISSTIILQAFGAEDLYWEGEEDASNEFLEVNKEDVGIGGRLKRHVAGLFDFFNFASPLSTTTETPPEQEMSTDDPDIEDTPGGRDEDIDPGSGISERVEPEPVEKTLRVTFVVMEPYQTEFSNRDSEHFRNFSQTLAEAVNALYDSLPGTQRASLVRIQSRVSDEFSCKVTLDILTTGYDNTDRITRILQDHIRNRRQLGFTIVSDADFGAAVIDSAALDTHDLSSSVTSRSSGCNPTIPCASSSTKICEEQRCNGYNDCPEGDDEYNCGTDQAPEQEQGVDKFPEGSGDESLFETTTDAATSTTTDLPFFQPSCPPGEFSCDDTRCVRNTARCDGVRDCSDGADEAGCKTCDGDDFRCNNGQCIEAARRCDRVVDCPNEEDEQNCVCSSTEFRCVSDGACIEKRKRCDGVNHCKDSSDEMDCACSSDKWQCDDGHCIQLTRRCDGRADCPKDRSDERNCRAYRYFKCKGGTLIAIELRCNRRYDCPPGDYTDEYNCPCVDGDFQCDNGHCIPKSKLCDSTHDCQDGSDERDCVYGTDCMAFEYKCSNAQCVPAESVCNGTTECTDSSDERNCPCKRGEFRCRDGSCINIARRCDGYRDCHPKGEDEINCESSRCPGNAFTCNPGSSIPCASRCDGEAECDNGEDEDQCDACSLICDGACVEESKICNGEEDCTDASDEIDCEQCDGPNDFRCKNAECINAELRCNGIPECVDESDEEGCNSTMISRTAVCSAEEFQCRDGTCINGGFYCDGQKDCNDNSDEDNCRCHEDQFQCSSGQCLPRSEYCDGVPDCSDGSDEQDCYSYPATTSNYDFRTETTPVATIRPWPDKYNLSSGSSTSDGSVPRGPGNTGSPGSSGGSGYPDSSVVTRYPDRPGYPGGSGYPGASGSSERPEYPGGPGYSGGTEYPGAPGSSGDSNFPGEPGASGQGGYQPGGYDSRYPGSGRDDNRYPGSGGDDSRYPGSGRDDSRYPGSGRDDSRYPGSGRDDSRYPGSGRDDSNYPGSGRDDSRYPGSDRDDSRYPGSGRDDSRYPGSGRDDSRYPGSGRDDSNYPGSGRDDSRYPGSGRDDSRYPGSGRDESNYPSTGTDDNRFPGPSRDDSRYGGSGRDDHTRDGCKSNEWRCENGPCIQSYQRCDGRVDCPLDSSDELDCPAGSPLALNLKTYPQEQTVRNGGDVVLQCRDEGPLRSPVKWVKEGGRIKPGSVERHGRLEINAVTDADGGTYICQAVPYIGQPRSELRVTVYVQPRPYAPRPINETCRPDEATCGNGQCIPKSAVCNGFIDCSDRSDEDTCFVDGKCDPNQFHCDNNKCILMTWLCDGDEDCGDGSDERDCGYSAPGQCKPVEFACHSKSQCIPKSFHCDGESDCLDRSDEAGCSPVYITQPPKPTNVHLTMGDTLSLTCSANGVPKPVISWRRNWGQVPDECTMKNDYVDSQVIGTLNCPNMLPDHNGAYSCEAMNNKGTTFAVPDAIVFVDQVNICPKGYFNSEAQYEADCIRCFCFGESTQCKSADLFTYNMPTPLGQGGTRLVGVLDPENGKVQLDPHDIGELYYYQPLKNGGAITKLEQYFSKFRWTGAVPYLTLPETYNGNQLTSYGGHIRYRVQPHRSGQDIIPDIIIKGKYQNLVYFNRGERGEDTYMINARLIPSNWVKPSIRGLVPSTREDIMMALDNVEMILLRGSVNNYGVNITDFVMESAQSLNAGLGVASLVEECICPPGYDGLSCQKCASGYVREQSGMWLGHCVPDIPRCAPGTYGDPASGYACRPCPCPLTEENNFATSCSIGPDGRVKCNCFAGYEGANCERCSAGYIGNPLVRGDACKPQPTDRCNPIGTSVVRLPDECACKDNVQGRFCDHCNNDSFFLSEDFREGCARCFCSGVTQDCRSSNLRRKTMHFDFNTPNIVSQVRVYDSAPQGRIDAARYSAPVETNLTSVLSNGVVTLNDYDRSRPTIYYWSLPPSFAGDKVTAYGGYLRYWLKNVAMPGLVPRNNAADIQLISKNNLNFHYFGNFKPTYEGQLNVSIQLLEKGWLRADGKEVPREHFLLALADVKAILIKATYTTNSVLASLVSASIDTADANGDGPAAMHVEQCICPRGYIGTSCEDCAPGFTRSENGIYLEHCGPCDCNGNSAMCHPETGVCTNCQNNTYGDNCENCKPGFRRDGHNNCMPDTWAPEGDCDPRGIVEQNASPGYCECKPNVEGPSCDRCRPGTFGLDASYPLGCYQCYCSGVTKDCHEASSQLARIPMAAPIFGSNYGGYKLMDLNGERVLNDHIVSMPVDSELMYVFNFMPDEELYWSLPVFPGNRVLSYGGVLRLKQKFESRDNYVSEPGTDVILVGDDKSIFWTNPQAINAGQPLSYQVPLTEKSWFVLNYETPATRSDFVSVLRNLRRVLVRATLVKRIESTSIADVAMDTASEMNDPLSPGATGVEICMCPEGYSGTSCEQCAPRFYKNSYGQCERCPCNGQDCSAGSDGRPVCNCQPPYTGRDCSSLVGESNVHVPEPRPDRDEDTTQNPPRSTVIVRITSKTLKIQEVGSSVNFTCEAQSRMSRGRLPVRWFKANGNLPQDRTIIDDSRGMLIITNLQVSDGGTYICQTSDGLSTSQASATIVVPAYAPWIVNAKVNDMTLPTVEIRPPIKDYYEGDRIELRCIAGGNPTPDVTWQRASGRALPLTYEVISDTLVIQSAREEDSGEYRCIARNTLGPVDRTAVVTVRRRSPPRREKLRVSQTSATLNEGQNIQITCTGPNNVLPETIDWIRNDGSEFGPNVHYDFGILYIEDARPEDQGVYICQSRQYRIDPIQVVVEVIPRNTPDPSAGSNITVSVERLTLPTGGSGSVDCTPIGYPAPLIKWKKYDGPFGPGVSQRLNSLAITDAREEDNGYYMCQGIIDNEIVASIYVFVTVEKLEAPKIDIWPQGEQAVTLGSPYELRCTVLAGVPEPTVYWSRNADRVMGAHVHLMANNILSFEKVDVNDEGEYLCTANNDAGKDTASTIIRVRSPPEITVTPGDLIQPVYGDPFIVECRANGVPLPMVSIKNATSLAVLVDPAPGKVVLRVQSASEQNEGDYLCYATSPAGTMEEQFGVRLARGDGGFTGDPGSGDVSQPYDGYPFDQQPRDLIAAQGQTSRISCNDLVNDNYVRWSRGDGMPLQRNAEQIGSELVINDTTKMDGGRYICNLYDRVTGEVQRSAYTNLVVLSAPSITLQPPTQTVHPGESPTVECVVTGDEIQQVTWRPVTRPFSNRIEVRRSTLIFNRIEVEDAGKYECFATNRVANVSAAAEVIVSEDMERAPWESHDHEQFAHVGSEVQLSCGVPDKYRVRWSKNGRPVPRAVETRRDGSLYIRLAQESDSGYYVCDIYDGYGKLDSNHINLHIHGDQECNSTQFRCHDFTGCVDIELLCDGDNDCLDESDEVNCILREKRERVRKQNSTGPRDSSSYVSIDQPKRPFRAGENVEIQCRIRMRGIQVAWERYGTRQYVDSRTFGDGAVLVIPEVQESDVGIYRCTGRDAYGRTSYEDFALEVQPVGAVGQPTYQSNKVVTYTARLGDMIDIPCDHKLEQPVSVEWRKEYSNDVRVNEPYLHLPSVSEADAGTYICRVGNSRTAVEVRTVLRVIGVVPRFDGGGWLTLPTIKDAYKQFDIEISFKPLDENGLILFNSQSNDRNGDYLALHLINGVPQFVLDSGAGPIIVDGDRPLQLNTWHTIRISKTNNKLTMDVDNNGPTSKMSTEWQLLELAEPLYIGGVRDYDTLPEPLAGTSGFIGCVSMLILGREEKNVIVESLERSSVFDCDSCSPNMCQNNGVCQEARNERGYVCLCALGFAGLNCDRTGEACRPGLCGPGKCTDTADGYKCACPINYTGKNCDVKQSIEYPAFAGSAYLAIKAPKASRFFRMSMKVKAAAPVTDGIIIYCAESPRGYGAFTALTVHGGRLQFTFDLGDGSRPVVLTSNKTLPANEWTDVHIVRVARTVTLKINVYNVFEEKLESAKNDLTLETPMFVGGVDDSVLVNKNLGVTGGFSGCIKDVTVYGDVVDIVGSSILSANVQECSNNDRGDIPETESICSQCRNGGECNAEGTGCVCPTGFSGQFCENRVPYQSRRLPTDPCAAQPCRNGGTCRKDISTRMNYSCDCELGYGGANCQMPLELLESVGFSGNGYIELPSNLIRYNQESEPVIIALAFHSNADGVLVYQYDLRLQPDEGDFIMIRVENGVVTLEWNMGDGTSSIIVDEVMVVDGERHSVIVKLSSDSATLTVDGTTRNGTSSGISNLMNADSNIYLGGIPRRLNTMGFPGLDGCIEQIEFMGASRPIKLGRTAVAGINAQMCRRSRA